MLRTKLIGAFAAAAFSAALLPAAAGAATSTASTTGSEAFADLAAQPQGRVTINVRVTRFASTAAGPRATGVATATLNGLGGTPTFIFGTKQIAAFLSYDQFKQYTDDALAAAKAGNGAAAGGDTAKKGVVLPGAKKGE